MKPKKAKKKEPTRYDVIQSYAKEFPKLGVTEKELRTYFGDFMMKKFKNFIDGQTCAVSDTGKCCIYPCDIDNFMGGAFDGQPAYFD